MRSFIPSRRLSIQNVGRTGDAKESQLICRTRRQEARSIGLPLGQGLDLKSGIFVINVVDSVGIIDFEGDVP